MVQSASDGGAYRRARKHKRRRMVCAVRLLEVESPQGVTLFDTLDLSEGGAYLRSEMLFDVDEELDLEFALTDGGPAIRARCRVVRVSRDIPSGMGVEFTRLWDEDRATIQAFLEKGA